MTNECAIVVSSSFAIRSLVTAPTMTTQRDYYEVLGIERSASNGEICRGVSQARREVSSGQEPGRRGSDRAVQGGGEAFEVLNDADKRSRYDRFGHAGLNGQSARTTSPTSRTSSRRSATFSATCSAARGRNRPHKGRDVRCDVTLTLKEAADGVTKKVEFQRHERATSARARGAAPGSRREVCGYCRGQGRVIQSAGIVRIQTTCPACHGEGSSDQASLPELPRQRARR